MTTNPAALVRAWLHAGPAGDVCGTRISTNFDARDGVPAIHIGGISGGPGVTAQTNLDVISTWNVALYVHGGRRANGLDDLPDDSATWQAVTAIGQAIRDLDWDHYQHASGARIVAGRIVSATPGIDPDTGESRATVTVALSVWE